MELQQLITDAINATLSINDAEIRFGKETLLYGPEASLDSLGLVTLIVEVEDRLRNLTGREILLVDERAMSANNSPFRTVGALLNHVQSLMKEND